MTPIFEKMSSFIRGKNSNGWRQYHLHAIEKDHDIEKLIEREKQNLYVKKEELDREIARIETFYKEDAKK